MRAVCLIALAACSSAPTLLPDGSISADSDGSVVAPPGWGERCGDGTDDDGDALVDEDCAPSLFAGMFAPQVAGDPALGAIETAANRPLRVVQTYHSLSAQGIARTPPDLAAIFARGQVAHLNVEPSGYTAQQYATPAQAPLATDLTAMGDAIASALAAAPRGRVLLTFGAEMNGNWTDWGCLPAAQYIALYRAAHAAITASLATHAIDRRRVRWAYGPNATSSTDCGSAAGYYPGHAYVDFLGMSAYRPDGATVDSAVLAPMRALFDALAYPAAWRRDRFIVLQTGARAASDRAAWIASLFATAAMDERMAGIIYFHAADWAATPAELGPAIATASVSSAALDSVFTPHYWDVGFDHPAFHEIQALHDAGITSGCAAAPARFCPDEPVRAADAQALLARAFPGASIETLAEPVRESDIAAAVRSLGGQPPDVGAGAATRARAAVIIAHGAELRPALL
jgi:hypothetical protein